MAKNRMRLIGLFDEREVLRRQFDRERADRIVEMRQLRRADDRRDNTRFGEEPGERDLRRLDPVPPGELDDAGGYCEVGVRVVQLVGEVVGLRARAVPEVDFT